ncbi:hypothetical protein LGW42_09665, partial [Streptococcus mutans]|nr:hypothetical protein [Streptococcus mutans]
GGSSGHYYVSGLPWFEAVTNFKDTKAYKKSRKLQLAGQDDVTRAHIVAHLYHFSITILIQSLFLCISHSL